MVYNDFICRLVRRSAKRQPEVTGFMANNRYAAAKARPGNAARGQNLLSGNPLQPAKISLLGLLWLFLPLFAALLLSLVLKDDQAAFLEWWITLFAFGAAAFPFTSLLFSGFHGKGYGFAKSLGLLSTSFILWTLCYIGIVPFNRIWVILILVVVAALGWGLKITRKAAVRALSTPADICGIAVEETIFVAALVFWCFIKGLYPDINGEEKFMDFAFLNSLVRTDTLPAPDPWLAGQSINYYYYGQYIFAYITKLNGVRTSVAYNLSMCTTFALSFTMSYSLGSLFIEGARKSGLKVPEPIRMAAGLLTAFAVSLFGNAHSFFYDENSNGNRFLYFLKDLGVNVGRTTNFFYPDSTRFIGHNPDSLIQNAEGIIVRNGDYTIHEFPCYSYMLGDLHAHVVGLMITMLIVAVLFAYYISASHPSGNELLVSVSPGTGMQTGFYAQLRHELKRLLKPSMIVTGVLLGIATMCNYWDFLIYFIVGCMVLLIYNIKTSRHFWSMSSVIFFFVETAMILICYLKFSKQAFVLVGVQLIIFGICFLGTAFVPTALSRTGLGMSFLFTSASLCSLTFNSKFEMIANSLAKSVDHTSFYQFVMVWGVHLIFAVTLLVLTIVSALKAQGTSGAGSGNGAHAVPRNTVARFMARMNPADLFMSGLSVVAFLLLLAPELFYVVDIYGGSYKRANTMFKFTFAGFVLLSLVLGYTLFRVICNYSVKNSHPYAAITGIIVLSLLLLLPAHYPLVSIEQRSGKISIANYKGLDGTAYLLTRDSSQISAGPGDLIPYKQAVEWLNENVEGQPVILEANGLSYTDSCIVSAYTGLPTVLGWQTHEWLWRFQGINQGGTLVSDPTKPDVWADIMTPRDTDIAAIYSSTDMISAKKLLDKYNVTYLIVGDLERAHLAQPEHNRTIDDTVMKNLGTVVFVSENETLYIVKVS